MTWGTRWPSRIVCEDTGRTMSASDAARRLNSLEAQLQAAQLTKREAAAIAYDVTEMGKDVALEAAEVRHEARKMLDKLDLIRDSLKDFVSLEQEH